ncbi:ATP-binding cassette transporter protein [Paraphysoderma sedebokerense]|nr:ATP-binding cassette transporter protein [Paraphysoderma sedebokerense]
MGKSEKSDNSPKDLDIELKEKANTDDKHASSDKDSGNESGGEDSKTSTTPLSISFSSLFRFSDTRDKVYIAIGTFGAILNGVALPLLTIVLGDLVNVYTKFDLAIEAKKTKPGFPPALYDAAKEEFDRELLRTIIFFIILAVVSFVVAYLQMGFWQIASESQAKKIRENYFKALLRQEMGWFDAQKRGELTSRISSDVQQIQEGIGDKVGITLQYIVTFITAFVVAFTKGPLLTAILCISWPLLVGSAAITGKLSQAYIQKSQTAYARSGAIAEETLGNIRTVASFTGEPKHQKDFDEALESARVQEYKRGYLTGAGTGTIFLVLFSVYALAFWWGSRLIADNTIDVGQLVNVLVAYIIGSFSLGNASPNFAAFFSAKVSGQRVFAIIDRQSEIDSFDESGEKPENVSGKIEFVDIDFAYPTRPDVPILKKFNLTIEPGETVALVGASGSGKSTTIGLLERYYTPSSGQVKLDGRDIKSLNIDWYRGRIGYVGQEPVLFEGSIRQNVSWGKSGEATEDEIITALKDANAYDFVMKLPDKLDTWVGERGALLSGGQKQRIAIARTLIRNPAICLLDEATSALDTESEGIVQEALNRASKGRTTIIVAHRLSTVRNADKIIVMKKGVVVEVGKHDELLTKKGYYYDLVHDQQIEVPTENSDTAVATSSSDSSTNVNDSALGYSKKEEIVDLNVVNPTVENLPVPVEKSLFMRTLRLSWSEKWMLLFGTISAMIAGSTTPAYAVIYAQTIADFGLAYIIDPTTGQRVADADKVKELGIRYAIYFVIIAVVAAVSNYLQVTLFIKSGEKLTQRLRSLCFAAFMRQEIAYFDVPEHSVGTLGAKLATQAPMVRSLVGDSLGTILQVSTGIIVAIIISFITGWQLALVVVAVSPLILFSGMLQQRAMRGLSRDTEKVYEKPGHLASEAIGSIRTVIAFGLQHKLLQMYHESLEGPYRVGRKKAFVSSVTFAISQSALFIVYAVAFAYAGYLVTIELYRFQDVFRVIITVIFASSLGGRLSAFLPSYSSAREAAIQIYQLLDRPSRIDSSSTAGSPPSVVKEGRVTFNDVHFRYPTRPNVMVHRGLSFDVLPGQKVALVGSSGCGKSTCIQLLERFYDPEKGKVCIDGVDVSTINIKALRSMLSLVSQEPCLFDGTILDNIKYGAIDPSTATADEVYEAAKQANVHEFIMSLPHRYDTMVGEKGTLLSGGQKQRVAIARALMRRPKILLLDEATSALDAESESLVQDALDKASVGRTTLIIAHRLSTVQNADVIFVLSDGKVVEQGTHAQLLNNKNHYYRLVMNQMEAVETDLS